MLPLAHTVESIDQVPGKNSKMSLKKGQLKVFVRDLDALIKWTSEY